MSDQLLELENKLRAEFTEAIDALRKSIERTNADNQSRQQLALVAKSTQDLMVLSQQIESDVYARVVEEINEKIVPKVNNMVEWVGFNMQDGTEIADDYRRKVEIQATKLDPNVKLLTSGVNDKRVISPYVRTFFGGPDEDTSSDD